MTKQYSGSCLCGNVSFTASGFNSSAAHCHCQMCRKFHGAAFGTLVEAQDFKWTTGHGYLREYVAENGTTRTFCSHCGASLAFRSKGAPLSETEIAISAFDDAVPVHPEAHIFTSYKANWYEIEDSLPQYNESRRHSD